MSINSKKLKPLSATTIFKMVKKHATRAQTAEKARVLVNLLEQVTQHKTNTICYYTIQ